MVGFRVFNEHQHQHWVLGETGVARVRVRVFVPPMYTYYHSLSTPLSMQLAYLGGYQPVKPEKVSTVMIPAALHTQANLLWQTTCAPIHLRGSPKTASPITF